MTARIEDLSDSDPLMAMRRFHAQLQISSDDWLEYKLEKYKKEQREREKNWQNLGLPLGSLAYTNYVRRQIQESLGRTED